ncbi:MAG: hypothetical protein ABIQ02_08140 [Saprospiraceae bacterium]
MSLTNLTQLTAAQYRALQITPFQKPPGVSSSGNPDSRVSFQLGGWAGTDVLAFTVTDQATANCGLSINGTASTNTLIANVANASNPSSTILYWTVNMGTGASNGDWQLSITVNDGDVNTGTWVFVKGVSPLDGDYTSKWTAQN